MDSNLSHTYSYNVTLWMADDTYPSTYNEKLTFEDSSTPHVVPFDGALEDLNVTIVDTTNLVEADTWIILISACGATDPLPAGASATLTSQDGTSAVAQLTLDRGFEGTVSGAHEVYVVNQHFTVRAAGTEMQSITVSNTGSSTSWTNGNPSYSLVFSNSTPTACFEHDAEDWELEVRHNSIRMLLGNTQGGTHATAAWCTLWLTATHGSLPYVATLFCQAELLWSLGLDVTVTRRKDATFAPNGYIYNVYFDGENLVSLYNPPLAHDWGGQAWRLAH